MIYTFGNCELDTDRFELRREGATQAVEPQVLRLLIHLVENRHRVITRAELFETIWEGRVVGDAALYSRIKSARTAVGEHGQGLIRTVSRTGYQFVAEVGERSAGPPSPGGSKGGGEPLRPRGLRPWLWGAATVAGLVVVLALWSRIPVSASSMQNALEVPSIAVLPFVDMGLTQEDDRFADGLTEELTDQLTQIPGVRVASRTSAFRFKGKNEDLRKIAQALGVSSLLEGSVRRDGDRLRITAQLIDSNGKHLWSRTYERNRRDIFSIQNDVARNVANAFSVTVDAASTAAGKGGTRNPDAHDTYLSARAAMIDPSIASPEDVRYALRQLQHAVTLDPDFAMAWTWLSLTYMKSDALPEKGTPEWKARAREAISRARQLEPDASWVLIAESLIAMQDLRWEDAEQLLVRARETANGAENPYACAGCLYMQVGEPREALKYFQLAKVAEPSSLAGVFSISFAHMNAGELDEADQALAEIQGMNGAHGMQMRYAVLQALVRRDPAAVVAATSRFPEGDPNHRLGKMLDDRESALAELRRLAPVLPKSGGIVANIPLGLWAAYFEDYELALTFFEAASKDSCNTLMLWNPLLKPMRQLPRFKTLVSELKLVDYWRSTGRWNDFCRPSGSGDFTCT